MDNGGFDSSPPQRNSHNVKATLRASVYLILLYREVDLVSWLDVDLVSWLEVDQLGVRRRLVLGEDIWGREEGRWKDVVVQGREEGRGHWEEGWVNGIGNGSRRSVLKREVNETGKVLEGEKGQNWKGPLGRGIAGGRQSPCRLEYRQRPCRLESVKVRVVLEDIVVCVILLRCRRKWFAAHRGRCRSEAARSKL